MQLSQPTEAKPTEAAVPQGRPPVVLLVDDDPTTLHMLSGMLQQEGIATLTAGTIESARCVASSDAFDLAVLDVHLPDGSGLDLIRVREARTGEALEANTAYIAPGGRQMRVVNGGGIGVIQVTDDPPENNCRPAVDYLFRSAAGQFPGRAMAVILTGMGSDGVLGLRLLKRHGCHVVAQVEASCIVYGMPRAAVEAGVVDAVLPLDQIAARIATQVRGGLF